MELAELVKWKDAKQVEVSGIVYAFQSIGPVKSPGIEYTYVSRTIGQETKRLCLTNLDKRIKSFVILGGTINSGKGYVTDLLKEKGFYAASTHDIVAGACDTLNLVHNRPNMQLIGFLCNINDPDVVQSRLASQFNAAAEKGCTRIVFDGWRFAYEADIHKLAASADCRVLTVFVDADYIERLERAISADKKSTHPLTSAEFYRQDRVEQELFGTAYTKAAAMAVLENDGKRDIKKDLEDVLKKYGLLG